MIKGIQHKKKDWKDLQEKVMQREPQARDKSRKRVEGNVWQEDRHDSYGDTTGLLRNSFTLIASNTISLYWYKKQAQNDNRSTLWNNSECIRIWWQSNVVLVSLNNSVGVKVCMSS